MKSENADIEPVYSTDPADGDDPSDLSGAVRVGMRGKMHGDGGVPDERLFRYFAARIGRLQGTSALPVAADEWGPIRHAVLPGELLPMTVRMGLPTGPGGKESADAAWEHGLLRYLTQRPEDADRALDVIFSPEGVRREVRRAFLGCLEDAGAGDALLRLAENGGDERLLEAYVRAASGNAEDVRRVRDLSAAAGLPAWPRAVRENILSRLNAVLMPGDQPPQARSFLENDAWRRVSTALNFVPPPAFADVRIEEQREFRLLSFKPAGTLREDPGLLAQIVAQIGKAYPAGDAEEFESDFLENGHAEFHVLTCGGVPMISMGMEGGFSGGLRYVDWLCANMDLGIRGLSPAFQNSVIRMAELLKGTFQAGKPLALRVSLEMGGVCDGIAEPGEYKHKGYLLSRLLKEDQGRAFPVRAAGSRAILKAVEDGGAPREEEWARRTLGGRGFRVCRVDFPGLNHQSQIDPDKHWFYRDLRRAFAEGEVLTALVRVPGADPALNAHYAVLELDVLASGRRKDVRAARKERRNRHAA